MSRIHRDYQPRRNDLLNAVAKVEMLEVRRLLCNLSADLAGPHLAHLSTRNDSAIFAGAIVGPLPAQNANATKLSSAQPAASENTTTDEALVASGLVSVGSQPTGPLSGKIVYTTPGHGWNWSDTLGRWATDRGENNNMVEDFGTQDQGTFYVDYLFRSGATIVPMRPVGRQLNEVVIDNDMAQVTYSGSWTTSTTGTRWYDEDYGAVADSDRYRFSSTSASETATATYTPNIPSAGFYPIYTWVTPSSNRTSQLYKINHTGGQTQVHVDHSMVGNGWVYLGTYHFNAGSSSSEGSAVVSNQGTTGKVVIADAIRFGNGMGDLKWGASGPGTGSVSGFPREDEHSYVWVYRGLGQGASPTIFDEANPFTAPAEMAGLMNVNTNPFGTSVYIGFHSNAGGGRGATGLYSTTSATPHQSDLATYVARQIDTDMRALGWDWITRTYASGGGFGEINNTYYNSEMDAIIIEVAFHDSAADAAIMRDPVGRNDIARATYEGTLEYFDNWGGLTSPVPVPSAPINVRAVSNASGQVTLNWAAGPSSSNYNGANGGAATSFRIYGSTDGYGFDGGTLVSGAGTTTATLSGLDPTLPYYFKVVAVNNGGESKPTEVVTALPSGGAKQVLIVNGFDRYDLTQDMDYALAHVGGEVDRVWARYNNSFDYVNRVHTAIDAARPGIHVASTSNEAVISGAVNLTDYDAVIWILGDESTEDDTFNATEQTKVTTFIDGGGHLFLSGSEIAWDLDQQNNGRSFYETTLKGNYVADDAGTYTATADASGIFNGMSNFAISNGSAFSQLDTQVGDVEFPDVIAPQSGAVSALTYSGGTGGTAAIQVTGTGGKGNIVMFGFAYEFMTSAARRQTAMGRILDFFSVAAIVDPTTAPDLLAASDSGSSNSDNRTNISNGLQFSVASTILNAAVKIYDGATVIGTGTGNGGSITITTTVALTDGLHNITATQTVSGNESPAAGPLAVTIDSIAPTVIGQEFTYGPCTMSYQFSEDVDPGADFTLKNLTTDLFIDSEDIAYTFDTGTNTAHYTFPGLPGGVLPDGAYLATLKEASEQSGNVMVGMVSYHFMFAAGTAAGDEIRVGFNSNTSMYDIYINNDGVPALEGGVDMDKIVIAGGDDDDLLTLDVSNGTNSPTQGMEFDGETGSDTLAVKATFDIDTVAFDPGVVTVDGGLAFHSNIENLSYDGNGEPDIVSIASGNVVFPSTQQFDSLTIDNASATLAVGGDKVIVAQTLSILNGGQLDLTDNDLIVKAMDYADVETLVKNGFAGFTWTGPGINSSTAAVTSGRVLGIANNASAAYTTFSGQSVTSSDILVKFTYLGDANLDGLVNPDDFTAFAGGFSGGTAMWTRGDFDYNGFVNPDDFTAFINGVAAFNANGGTQL